MSPSPDSKTTPNALVRFARKLYHPLGFSKGYNFTLWFVFGGALLGFVLARLQYLSLTSRFCPATPANDGSTGLPSACYWVTQFPRYKVAMGLHLATSLPGALLAVFQFVPAIRHRYILYHRIAGYAAVLLMVIANAGAMMLADTAMGGDLVTQTFIGLVGLGTTATFGLALYNIRRQQLDQHRAWMLRTWFYLGFIITLRLIQALIATVLTNLPGGTTAPRPDHHAPHALMSCPQLLYVFAHNATALHRAFPVCAPSNAALLHAQDGVVPVPARLGPDRAENAAALEVSFAAAGALALALHAVGVEVYLRLTGAEEDRLRRVSWERQRARGFRNPGSAGLVRDRVGDGVPWVTREEEGPGVVGAEDGKRGGGDVLEMLA
ncbi:hypothetical protein B0J12DRAFT_714898 [Macrophomina phaseolina]|uniref:Uncharacterized protein n=1 Tax=Macrophomina phaseolina TaxID=35725 RepID=A0ABQ8FQL7_9PEZI|nr:hypothetical protein B0J12DRAFT_714898 [Macrophomina phaseolina]